jgi:hypothetical protein
MPPPVDAITVEALHEEAAPMMNTQQTGPSLHPFTEAELLRLATYRAAIQAGFYTDLLPGAASGGDAESLTIEEVLTEPAPAAFTEHELIRLVACRAAVAAGLYSDDIVEAGNA